MLDEQIFVDVEGTHQGILIDKRLQSRVQHMLNKYHFKTKFSNVNLFFFFFLCLNVLFGEETVPCGAG